MRCLHCLLAVIFAAGCSGGDRSHEEEAGGLTAAVDYLDHHITPSAAEDWSAMPFADQGAWFGFSSHECMLFGVYAVFCENVSFNCSLDSFLTKTASKSPFL